MDCLEVTIFAGPNSHGGLIQELLNVRNYLSNRVRNLVNVELKILEEALDPQAIGIAVDGFLIHENSLAGLVDILHLQLQQDIAA